MRALREAQRGSPRAFAMGLSDLFAGAGNDEAEAAGSELAEILLMHRAWLKGHFEKKE